MTYPEPPGASLQKGFVKRNPLNNAYYLEQWKDDAWYPALVECDRELEALLPGYNITQIKEKFGGLRYYVTSPEGKEMSREDWAAVIEITNAAERRCAEIDKEKS